MNKSTKTPRVERCGCANLLQLVMILRVIQKPFNFLLTGKLLHRGVMAFAQNKPPTPDEPQPKSTHNPFERFERGQKQAAKKVRQPPPTILKGQILKLRSELRDLEDELDEKLVELEKAHKKSKSQEEDAEESEESEAKKTPPPPTPQLKFLLPNKQLRIVAYVGLFFFLMLFLDKDVTGMAELHEEDFVNRLNQNRIKRVTVVRELHRGTWRTHIEYTSDNSVKRAVIGSLGKVLAILNDYPAVIVEFEHRVSGSAKDSGAGNTRALIEIAVSVLLIYIMVRGTKAMSEMVSGMTKQKYKPTPPTISKVKFDDVAGMKEAKLEISEFVEFLKMPEKFTEMGAKIPRGALLTGPPGTGKTLLAKACAGQAGVPFFYMSGSEFIEKYVGVGASRVRSLFESASKKAPSIIFIDEIDAIGKKRSVGPRGNEERDNTLNQLLVNMDGFGTNSQIVVIAATNRKDMLDPALMRPGRFDRIIEVTLPDREGRHEILLVHLSKVKFDPTLTKEQIAQRLASLTPSFSGADLGNLCNEAAIIAARHSKSFIEMVDFDKATERVLAGLEKRNNLSPEERKIVAFHEAARAITAWFLEGADPILKITIIPRSKKALGHTQFLHNQSVLNSKQDLLDRICCALASRVVEELVMKEITDSSSEDLKKAQEIAHKIVTEFGMSQTISNIGFPQHEIIKKHYSGELEVQIDNEVSRIIKQESTRVKELLRLHLEKLNKLCEDLLQKQTLNHDDIKAILGERPFQPKSNYKAFLDITKARQNLESEKEKNKEGSQKPNTDSS